jgi:hypothetical protein
MPVGCSAGAGNADAGRSLVVILLVADWLPAFHAVIGFTTDATEWAVKAGPQRARQVK